MTNLGLTRVGFCQGDTKLCLGVTTSLLEIIIGCTVYEYIPRHCFSLKRHMRKHMILRNYISQTVLSCYVMPGIHRSWQRKRNDTGVSIWLHNISGRVMLRTPRIMRRLLPQSYPLRPIVYPRPVAVTVSPSPPPVMWTRPFKGTS